MCGILEEEVGLRNTAERLGTASKAFGHFLSWRAWVLAGLVKDRAKLSWRTSPRRAVVAGRAPGRGNPVSVLLSILALSILSFPAQSATNVIPTTRIPIEVTAARTDTRWIASQASSTVLSFDEEPLVLLNWQGSPGAQSDISIRGSSFSEAGLSLGGLALGNPQTEHFHAELPIPSLLLTRPEVGLGLDQALRTDGYLVGTIRMDLQSIGDEVRFNAGLGNADQNWQRLRYAVPLTPRTREPLLSFQVFAERDHAEQLGFADNDLDRFLLGGHLQYRDGDSRTDLLVSTQAKEFGGRGFYGVTPDWAADEETADLLVFGSTERRAGRWPWRGSVAWRRFEDTYRLFTPGPGIYENRHEWTDMQVALDGRGKVSRGATWHWRIAAGKQELEGTRLGNHERERGVAQLVPEWRIGAARLRAGAQYRILDDDARWLPLVDLAIPFTDTGTAVGSYTETVREPSFTELNYDSPGSLGNQGLEAQESRNLEIGWRQDVTETVLWQLALFRRESQNTVDWVKSGPGATRWVATDLGTVDTIGAEFIVQCLVGDEMELRAAYTLLDKDTDDPPYAARYALDYPEHLFRLVLDWQMNSLWKVVSTHTARRQIRNPARGGDRDSLYGRLAIHVTPRQPDGMSFTFAIDNLWKDDFEPVPGLPSTGRRASVAATIVF